MTRTEFHHNHTRYPSRNMHDNISDYDRNEIEERLKIECSKTVPGDVPARPASEADSDRLMPVGSVTYSTVVAERAAKRAERERAIAEIRAGKFRRRK